MVARKFCALFALWLFMAVILVGGCGGGGGSGLNTTPTPITSPDKTPITSPDITPLPTPITSPDNKTSPDNETLPPTPIISPDPTPIISPDPEPIPTPSGYAVTFETNGGSSVAGATVSYGATIEQPEAPVREGYVFAGWYKDEALTEDFTFGADGDKITGDTTIYARWVSIDALRAEYVLGEIVIGYSQGDNPKYVTQNLTLTTQEADANISWSSSNPEIISSAGKVIRPIGNDSDVTLTATAKYGTETLSRDFTVRVIHARSRLSSDVELISVDEAGSNDISIKYSDSRDQVIAIEGNYSKITIRNADDALDALQAIHNQLGISNPYEELKTSVVTSDSSGAEYKFGQVHNGVRVYGYGVMASANSAGKGDFLHANLLSSDIIDSLDKAINEGRINLTLKTSDDAENAVKNLYSGSVEADSVDTEMIIFALGEHENSPVYAYILNVSGVEDNGGYVDETVIISAVSSAVIWKSPNINEAHHSIRTSKTVTDKNEAGDNVSFPVKLSNGYWIMIDDTEEPTIEIYSGDYVPDMRNFSSVPTTLVRRKPGQENSDWDSQAVSAYTNMREVMRWWKASFDRDSLDGKGMPVKIIVHQNIQKEEDGSITKDNACWMNYKERFYFSDKQDRALSCASAVDVMTHESTHAVLQYVTGLKNWGEESPLRSISEGYSDVFACIKDKNWIIGENLSPNYRMRDIATKYAGDFSTDAYVDSVHYVSYLAYLMYKNGLTWDELAKVWYKSMSMTSPVKVFWWTTQKKTLNKEATFESVRNCLRWAAEKLAEAGEFPREKLSCVYDALDEVFYSPATLSGTVTDYDSGRPVANASIGIKFSSQTYNQDRSIKTDKNGNYSRRLYNEDGICYVQVNADGYSQAEIYGTEIESSQNATLNIQLVKRSMGSLSGTIRNISDDSPLENVRVAIKTGFNSGAGYEYSDTLTDINGRYSFDVDSISTGHYTLELRKIGYNTTSLNVIINGNSTVLDGHMSEGTTFRHNISQIDAEIDINALASGSKAYGWSFSDGVLNLNRSIVYRINGNGLATSNRIAMSPGTDSAVILNNVNIDVSGTDYACAFDVTSADVELFIQGNNSLKSGKTRAGLEVPDGASITISSIHDDNTDSLNAEGGYYGGAGIGGPGSDNDNGKKGRAGTIIIYSGTITATGNYYGGAGIGGGDSYSPDGGGLIIIYGGNITATAKAADNGNSGAGIGSGYYASGGGNGINDDGTKIFILGGTITALSDGNGAGIGGGAYSDGGVIRILDGLQSSITAKGGDGAQDIGYGKDGKISDVAYVDATTLETMIAEALVEKDSPNDSQALPVFVGAVQVSEAQTLPAMSKENHSPEILAVLPPFTPSSAGTYTFTASLDHMPPEGAQLILLSDSEDLNASFTFTESPDVVRVSADFSAGRLYSPVVATEYDSHSQGGCSALNLGALLLFAGIIFAGVKRF